MRKRLPLVRAIVSGLIAMVSLASSAWAKLEVKIESGIKPGEDFLTATNWCPFAEDAFVAKVSDEGKTLANIEYCATYGKSDAQAFTDKRGRNYVLIDRNTQRGTHAVWRDLEIYRIVPGYYEGYDTIAVIPVNEPAGPCYEVGYSYDIKNSPRGGLKLMLVRKIIQEDPGCEPLPDSDVRPDKRRIILIDTPER
jgi:hypothetical protein